MGGLFGALFGLHGSMCEASWGQLRKLGLPVIFHNSALNWAQVRQETPAYKLYCLVMVMMVVVVVVAAI